jgi:hypothetical protein
MISTGQSSKTTWASTVAAPHTDSLLVNGIEALTPNERQDYNALKNRLALLQQTDVDC